jgi:hypothetical protein
MIEMERYYLTESSFGATQNATAIEMSTTMNGATNIRK